MASSIVLPILLSAQEGFNGECCTATATGLAPEIQQEMGELQIKIL